MSEYEQPEEQNYFEHKRHRPPPPYMIGEKVLWKSPSTGRELMVEFRGWDQDLAVVRTETLGLMRVQLASLRKAAL